MCIGRMFICLQDIKTEIKTEEAENGEIDIKEEIQQINGVSSGCDIYRVSRNC